MSKKQEWEAENKRYKDIAAELTNAELREAVARQRGDYTTAGKYADEAERLRAMQKDSIKKQMKIARRPGR